MTKGKKMKIKPHNTKMIFSWMVILSILLMNHVAHAQNFANFVPVETEQTEDFLSDDEIEKILMEENIPLTSSLGPIPAEGESKYTLGATDVIAVSVLRHPEVSGQFVINMEGKIQYEFVGDIEIAGKTKNEIATLLTEVLSKYIISPEVTVKIVGYNSKVVYVIGEVGNPGKIYMRGDTITIREALIQAGLPLLSAKSGKTRLITPADDGKAKQINVNVYKLLYKGDLRENLVMKPGDTLFVPPTVLAKTMRVLQPITGPIGPARTIYTTGTTGF